MKKLIAFLLAALLLTGCAAPAETTVPVATTLPTETVPTTVAPDPMDILLESMTLREKVGQLFIARAEQLLPEAGFITEVTLLLYLYTQKAGGDNGESYASSYEGLPLGCDGGSINSKSFCKVIHNSLLYMIFYNLQ